MTYPSEWLASSDPAIESGEAVYKVEGIEYRMRLECFEDFQKVSRMLDESFKQGKVFAAQAIKGHLGRALDAADQQHDLR